MTYIDIILIQYLSQEVAKNINGWRHLILKSPMRAKATMQTYSIFLPIEANFTSPMVQENAF